jgi:4-alpha-glucanotransferase
MKKGALNKRLLHLACRMWSIQPSYTNTEGKTIWSPKKTLLHLLGLMTGREKIQDNLDLTKLIQMKKKEKLERRVNPVIFLKSEISFPIIIPQSSEKASIRLCIEDEDGVVAYLKNFNLDVRFISRRILFEEEVFLKYHFKSKKILPNGTYTGKIAITSWSSTEEHLFLILAFSTVGANVGSNGRKSSKLLTKKAKKKGIFAPLYALRSEHDWGIGSFSDLLRLQKICQKEKIHWAATLPLLAKAWQSGYADPSPYTPSTKLFWNEIFLDVEKIVHHSENQAMKEQLRAPKTQTLLHELRKKAAIDYGRIYELKKRFLDPLSLSFFEEKKHEDPRFQDFLNQRPELQDYCEEISLSLQETRFHLYCQFQVHQQLEELRVNAFKSPYGWLYLDLPLGVSSDGYDQKKYQSHFLKSCSTGAPPDPLFREGQNWGFAPLHPDKMRKDRYVYFRKMIQNQFRYARVLRIDHIMGLHRIYVIPDGASAKDGGYIRFANDELFAIVALEAERAGGEAIGEDLGTVPDIVRQKMNFFGLKRMWVLQIEAEQKQAALLEDIPSTTISSLNTHDMPTFAAFWTGVDIDLRQKIGHIERDQVSKEKKEREELKKFLSDQLKGIHLEMRSSTVAKRLYNELLQSKSAGVMLNLEDLWGEIYPQNIPGTFEEYPNWCRRHQYLITEWCLLLKDFLEGKDAR